MDLNQRFPCVDDMEKAARRRIPRFAFVYLYGGIGREVALSRNRTALDAITMNQRYLVAESVTRPNLSTEILGRRYDLPFGISPIGLSGLVWPKASEILAAAAAQHNIPTALSTFATSSLADIHKIAGDNAWFQLYLPNDPEIRKDLIKQAEISGYETLIITVDIPTQTRRDRDLRVGLSVPPKLTARTLFDIACQPRWVLETLHHGQPVFKTLTAYIPKSADLNITSRFLTNLIEGQVTHNDLALLRDHWKGKLVVKGIMSSEDALTCKSMGVDAIWVSNHGGRQLDAACAPIEILPEFRNAVGKRYPVFADSGPRTGLDIVRMLACCADFVFLGRAFMYSVAAFGARGADHVISILREELRSTLVQLGCSNMRDLPKYRDNAKMVTTYRK